MAMDFFNFYMMRCFVYSAYMTQLASRLCSAADCWGERRQRHCMQV